MVATSAIRVLHVLGGLDRGGVETWLLHVLRHMDRQAFHMDFLVHQAGPGAYDDEVRTLGSRIYPCSQPHRPRQYARKFKAILREHGPFDIVHSHVHHYSGYVLRLAHEAGVPMQIAHSHNDTSPLDVEAGLLRRGYLALMRRWIRRYATHGLAASRKAAVSLFGPRWAADPRWQVLYYGLDLAPFQDAVDRAAVRAELGISPSALVIGHVGRFDRQKNHAFLVDIFAEVVRRNADSILLLVGEGDLRPAIEEMLSRRGLTSRVRFTGSRPDVPRLMLGAMDAFVFPSWFEGLGLVLVEAQAAGLPCVISDAIPEEAILVEPLVRRVSLAQTSSAWAAEVLALHAAGPSVPAAQARVRIEHSPVNIRASIHHLESVYHGVGLRHRAE